VTVGYGRSPGRANHGGIAPKEKNARVTLVYQHELPNVPGESIKGVLVVDTNETEPTIPLGN
jgi:hypothetical protein